MLEGKDLLAAVREVAEGFGCTAVQLGPDAVAVKGDTRHVGPSVIVRFPKGMNYTDIFKISTLITNRVPEICRVLQEIKDGDTIAKIPRHKMREPFIPMTGNPEAGNYLDYYTHLREGDVVSFPERKK